MNALLFTEGDFISHAGLPLSWKLECDAISPDEWKCIAKMIMDYQTQSFRIAIGIPRGGVVLGHWLNEYASGDAKDPVLVADDVYTTGTSFKEYCEKYYPNEEVYKWCVFARRTPEYGVRALFTMPDIGSET